jgi:hypothetical protein
MRKIAIYLLLGLVFSCTAFAVEGGGVLPATMEKYQKTKEKVEAMAGTTVAKYAPEAIEAAEKSIVAAQEGLKSGNEMVTAQQVEMTLLQLTLAVALADERAAAEKTAAAAAKLQKTEQLLADILAGKGDK